MLQSLDIEKIIPSSPRPALRLQVFLINGVKIRSPPPSHQEPPHPSHQPSKVIQSKIWNLSTTCFTILMMEFWYVRIFHQRFYFLLWTMAVCFFSNFLVSAVKMHFSHSNLTNFSCTSLIWPWTDQFKWWKR